MVYTADFLEVLVTFEPEKVSSVLYRLYKNFELLDIFRESWENIDVVPCYASKYGYMRFVPVEFWCEVNR